MNNGMLAGASTPKLEFVQDERYARVDWDAPEATVAAGMSGGGVWNTHAFNRIASDDDGLIEKVVAGVVFLKPGRYFTRATMVMTQCDLTVSQINDVQTNAKLSLLPMYSANNKLFSALHQHEAVIDVRNCRGIRFQMTSSTGNSAQYTTGMEAYAGSPTQNGDRECHGLWEFWEQPDR